ncbi:hypothetical protein NEMBOFW57_007142 [Staphylotrichum longicolle]|uniref:Uncharacterized protein n=1 Tax=Staphylotrichum longicolle TaxID=669026 RepID=A0AAD4HV02_9PEZI|nr:hypothetical protein NEMBOFW57_007142 [Staphylotrichum longicolle]
MAILLKAADMEAAAGLEIETQEISDKTGKVAGRLPDVGRLAFLDAQSGMTAIRSIALRMIEPEGSIAYILELLNDPEDAQYNLKPEIAAIKKTAQKCLENSQQINQKFRYWYLVIMHLKETSLSKKGDIVKEKETTNLKQKEEESKEQRFDKKKQALKERISLLKTTLDEIQRRVDKKEDEVQWLRHAPVQPEPSILEDIELVRRMIPQVEAPTINRGRVVGVKDFFFGQSNAHREEDEAILRKHEAKIERMRQEAMDMARAQRREKLEKAASELKQAKEEEAELVEELKTARKELSNSTDQLAEVSANLERAKSEFQRLKKKDLELEGILAILENSSRELGHLKEKIEKLVEFFQQMLVEIQDNVEIGLQDFLRPIENGIKEGKTPEQVEAIKVSDKSKRKIMSSALLMQGRFSAIMDISTAYIAVSRDYIRPAITEMEDLSAMSESEWAVQSKHFLTKCKTWTEDIETVTKKASDRVEVNAKMHMNALQARAIEAAEEV